VIGSDKHKNAANAKIIAFRAIPCRRLLESIIIATLCKRPDQPPKSNNQHYGRQKNKYHYDK
jgi:hypothetical protein